MNRIGQKYIVSYVQYDSLVLSKLDVLLIWAYAFLLQGWSDE